MCHSKIFTIIIVVVLLHLVCAVFASSSPSSASSSCFSRSNRGRFSCFEVSAPEISYLMFSTSGESERVIASPPATPASIHHEPVKNASTIAKQRFNHQFRNLQNDILYPKDVSSFPIFVQARTFESQKALNILSSGIESRQFNAKLVMKRQSVLKATSSATTPILSLSDLLLKDDDSGDDHDQQKESLLYYEDDNLYFSCRSVNELIMKNVTVSSKKKQHTSSATTASSNNIIEDPLLILHCSLDYPSSNIVKINTNNNQSEAEDNEFHNNNNSNSSSNNNNTDSNNQRQYQRFATTFIGRAEPYHSWLLIEESDEGTTQKQKEVCSSDDEQQQESRSQSSLLPLLALPISPIELPEITRIMKDKIIKEIFSTTTATSFIRKVSTLELVYKYKQIFARQIKKLKMIKKQRDASSDTSSNHQQYAFFTSNKDDNNNKNNKKNLLLWMYPASLSPIFLAAAEPQGALKVNIATSSPSTISSTFLFNTASGGRVLDSLAASCRRGSDFLTIKNDNKNDNNSINQNDANSSYFLLQGGASTSEKIFLRVALSNTVLAVDQNRMHHSTSSYQPHIPLREKGWNTEFFISQIELEYLGCDIYNNNRTTSSFKQIYTAEDEMTLPSWGGYWKIVIEMTRNYGRNLRVRVSPAIIEVAGFCMMTQDQKTPSTNHQQNFINTGPDRQGDMPIAETEFLMTEAIKKSLSSSSSVTTEEKKISQQFASFFPTDNNNNKKKQASIPVELVRFPAGSDSDAIPKICSATRRSSSDSEQTLYRLFEVVESKTSSDNNNSNSSATIVKILWYLRQLPDAEDYLQSGLLSAGDKFAICSRKDFVSSGLSSSTAESFGLVSHAKYPGPINLEMSFPENFVSAKTKTVLPGETMSIHVTFDSEGFALHSKSLWVEFGGESNKYFALSLSLKNSGEQPRASFSIQINDTETIRAGMCGDIFVDVSLNVLGSSSRSEVLNVTKIFSEKQHSSRNNRICFRGITTVSPAPSVVKTDSSHHDTASEHQRHPRVDDDPEEDQEFLIHQSQPSFSQEQATSTTSTMKDIPFSLSSLSATRFFVRSAFRHEVASSCDLVFDQSEHTVKTSTVASTFSVLLVPTLTEESLTKTCKNIIDGDRNSVSNQQHQQRLKNLVAFCDPALQRVSSECSLLHKSGGCNGEFSFIHQKHVIQQLLSVDWIRKVPFSVQRCETEFRPAAHVEWLATPPMSSLDDSNSILSPVAGENKNNILHVSGWTLLYLMKHNDTHQLASPIIAKALKQLGPKNVSILFDGLSKMAAGGDDESESNSPQLTVLEQMKRKLKAKEWSKEQLFWDVHDSSSIEKNNMNNNDNNNGDGSNGNNFNLIVSQFAPDHLNRVLRVCGTELDSKYDLLRIVPEAVSSSRSVTEMTLDPFYAHNPNVITVLPKEEDGNNNNHNNHNSMSGNNNECVVFNLPTLHIEGTVDFLYCFRCADGKKRNSNNNLNSDSNPHRQDNHQHGELRLEEDIDDSTPSSSSNKNRNSNKDDYESEIMTIGTVIIQKSFEPSFESLTNDQMLPYLIAESPFRISLTPKSTKHSELTSDVIHASLKLIQKSSSSTQEFYDEQNDDSSSTSSSSTFFDCSSSASVASSSSLSFSFHAMMKEQGGQGSLYTIRPVSIKSAGKYEMCVAFSSSSSSSSTKSQQNEMQWVRAGSVTVVGVDETEFIREIEKENSENLRNVQENSDELVDPFGDQYHQRQDGSAAKTKKKVRIFGTTIFGGKFLGSSSNDDDDDDDQKTEDRQKTKKKKKNSKKNQKVAKRFTSIPAHVGSSSFSLDLPVFVPSDLEDVKNSLVLRAAPSNDQDEESSFTLPVVNYRRDQSPSSASSPTTKRIVVTFQGEIPATVSTIKMLSKSSEDEDESQLLKIQLGLLSSTTTSSDSRQQTFSFTTIKSLRLRLVFPLHRVTLGETPRDLLTAVSNATNNNTSTSSSSSTGNSISNDLLFLAGSQISTSVSHEPFAPNSYHSFDLVSKVHFLFFDDETKASSSLEENNNNNNNNDICHKFFRDLELSSSEATSVRFSSRVLKSKCTPKFVENPELGENCSSESKDGILLPTVSEINTVKKTHRHRSKPNAAICYSIAIEKPQMNNNQNNNKKRSKASSTVLFSQSIRLLGVSRVQQIGSQGLRGVVSLFGDFNKNNNSPNIDDEQAETIKVILQSSDLSLVLHKNSGSTNNDDDSQTDEIVHIISNPSASSNIIISWICQDETKNDNRKICNSSSASSLVFAISFPLPLASTTPNDKNKNDNIEYSFSWRGDYELVSHKLLVPHYLITTAPVFASSSSLRTESIQVLSNLNTPIPPTQPLSSKTLEENFLRHSNFEWRSTNGFISGRVPHKVTLSVEVQSEEIAQKLVNGSLQIIATSGRIPDSIFSNLMFYREAEDVVDVLPALSSGFLQALSMRAVASGYSVSVVENVRLIADEHDNNNNNNKGVKLHFDFYTQHAGYVTLAIVDTENPHNNNRVRNAKSPFLWERMKLDRNQHFVSFMFHKISGVRAIVHEPLLRVFGVRYFFFAGGNSSSSTPKINLRRIYITKSLPCRVENSIGYSSDQQQYNTHQSSEAAGGQAELLWVDQGVGPWISDEVMASSTAEDVSLLVESRHSKTSTARLVDLDDSSTGSNHHQKRHTLIATLRPMAYLIKNGDSAFVCAKYQVDEDNTNSKSTPSSSSSLRDEHKFINTPLDLASPYRFNDLLDLTSNTLGKMPSLGFAIIGLNHNKIVKSVAPDSRFWYGLKETDYKLFFRHSPSDKCPSILPASLLKPSSSSASSSLTPAIPIPRSLRKFLSKNGLEIPGSVNNNNNLPALNSWLFQVAGAGHYCAYITQSGFSLNCGKVHIPGPLYATPMPAMAAVPPVSSSSSASAISAACSPTPTVISTRALLVAGQPLEYPKEYLFLSAPPLQVLNAFLSAYSSSSASNPNQDQRHPCEFGITTNAMSNDDDDKNNVSSKTTATRIAKLYINSKKAHLNFPASSKDVRRNYEVSSEMLVKFRTSGTFVICAKRPISKDLLALRRKMMKHGNTEEEVEDDRQNKNKIKNDIFASWGKGVTNRPVKMMYPSQDFMSVFLSTIKVSPPSGRRFQLLSKAHYEIDLSYSYYYSRHSSSSSSSSSSRKNSITPVKLIWTIRAFFPSSQISTDDRNSLDWLFTKTKQNNNNDEKDAKDDDQSLPRRCGENAGAHQWGVYVTGLMTTTKNSNSHHRNNNQQQHHDPVLLELSSDSWKNDGGTHDSSQKNERHSSSDQQQSVSSQHQYHPKAIASTWRRSFETKLPSSSSSSSSKVNPNDSKSNSTSATIIEPLPESLLAILHQWCVDGDADVSSSSSSSGSSRMMIPRDRLLLKWRIRASGLDFDEDQLFDHPLRLSSCSASEVAAPNGGSGGSSTKTNEDDPNDDEKIEVHGDPADEIGKSQSENDVLSNRRFVKLTNKERVSSVPPGSLRRQQSKLFSSHHHHQNAAANLLLDSRPLVFGLTRLHLLVICVVTLLIAGITLITMNKQKKRTDEGKASLLEPVKKSTEREKEKTLLPAKKSETEPEKNSGKKKKK